MTTQAQKWTPTDLTHAQYVGILEWQDEAGEWHSFDVQSVECASSSPETCSERLVFGGFTNTGFLESGFIQGENGESIDQLLNEMQSDFNVYYDEGPDAVSRIVCNERM